MRLLHVTLVIAVFLALLSIASGQEGVAITIQRISQDDQIKGNVTGLTKSGRESHKILVYVKTDKWYIHPYAQGGEGKSWAAIADDGSWKIETVRREFAASSIAALVVPKESRAPSKVTNVRAIPNKAIIVRELEGTPDYGKL